MQFGVREDAADCGLRGGRIPMHTVMRAVAPWTPGRRGRPALTGLGVLIAILLLALAGCASKPRPAPPPPPEVVVSASTWRLVDRDIFAASQNAAEEASDYARERMNRWRTLVYQRTETEFIPWFSSYWTRQWMGMKVTWYQLNANGEKDAVVNRLALYLREQYQERVLDPVAKEINPDWIMGQTTLLYVRQLRDRIQAIPPRYGVPLDQFDQRLQQISAIKMASSPEHSASLYQLVHAEPIDQQPAYLGLMASIGALPGRPGDWSEDPGLSSVARRTSRSLLNERNSSGVASAVAAAVGKAAGMMISLGTAGLSAMLREKERPQMEQMLRKNLDTAFDHKWQDWLNNPDRGVLAGVHHLTGQVEGHLFDNVAQPAQSEPAVQDIAVPEGRLLRYGSSIDDHPERTW